MRCVGVHASLRTPGRDIPAQLLTRFGMEVLVHGDKQGAPARLDVTMTHPPLHKPGAKEPITQRQWEVPACVGAPALVAWTFLSEWELVPGDWSISLSHHGTHLLTERFTITEGELALPEAQLSFSLTPAPVRQQVDNATAIAPSQAIAILARMRDVAPEQTALFYHKQQADAYVQAQIEKGIPAMAVPMVRGSGIWHSVAVWDFTRQETPQPADAPPAPTALAIQLAMYTDRDRAEVYADSLRQFGLQVSIESLWWDDQALHSVRTGPFDATRAGRDQAARAMRMLRGRGVPLPLLTITPEPLPHALVPEAAPVSPAPLPALPTMAKAKDTLSELLEKTMPDNMLPPPKDDAASDSDADAQEGGHMEKADEGGGPRNPWQQPAAPVATLAETGALGQVGQVAVQLGPFASRSQADAFRKEVESPAHPAVVKRLGSKQYVVQSKQYPNHAAAMAAGRKLLAAHAPDLALEPLVVKEGMASATPGASALSRPRGLSQSPDQPPEQGTGRASSRSVKSVKQGYSLQLTATASEDEATRQAEGWREKGLEVYIAEQPGALGVVFTVRYGEHATLADAQKAAAGILADHGVNAIVVEAHAHEAQQ